MRKSSEVSAGSAERISGNIYAFRVPDHTRGTSSAFEIDAKGNPRDNSNSSQCRANFPDLAAIGSEIWPFDLTGNNSVPFDTKAVSQPIISNEQATFNRGQTAKNDDAIPSFFTRVRNVEGSSISAPLSAVLLGKVLTSFAAGRETIENSIRLASEYCRRRSEALFCCTGVMVGILILANDSAINVSRAREQIVHAASQVHFKTPVQSDAPVIQRLERGVERRALAKVDLSRQSIPDATSASLQRAKNAPIPPAESKAGVTLGTAAEILPVEPVPTQTVQISVPSTTLSPISGETMRSQTAVSQPPATVAVIEAPEKIALSDSTVETVVSRTPAARGHSGQATGANQTAHRKIQPFRKALVKATPEKTQRAAVTKRKLDAAVPVKRPLAAMVRSPAISKLGASSVVAKKKRVARVPKMEAESPEPIVAVRTLDEAMARQYGSK